MDQFDLNENLIARLGLADAPEEQRLKILKQATDLVMKRVMLRLMENLPADEVNEANRLAGQPEELIAFLSGKVADFGALMAAEIANVKNEIILEGSAPENE